MQERRRRALTVPVEILKAFCKNAAGERSAPVWVCLIYSSKKCKGNLMESEQDD